MISGRNLISIWFFIGVLILCYGVLILGASLFMTPNRTVVLGELHFDVWWGLLMTALGLFYTLRFAPRKKKE
jgi:hypothetical protein